MINKNKLKQKVMDASIVIGTIGTIGIIGIASYLIAEAMSNLNKISFEDNDDEEESWWN